MAAVAKPEAVVEAAPRVVERVAREIVKAALGGDEVWRLILGDVPHFAPRIGAE